MIKTANVVLSLQKIAAHPSVVAVCRGGEDFVAATGAEPTTEALRLPKLLVNYAAKPGGKLSLGLLGWAAQLQG